MTAIIGWDLGRGGGAQADAMPSDRELVPVVLVPANNDYSEAEGAVAAVLDVWGLDPKLTLAVDFIRAENPNHTWGGIATDLTATIRAYTLRRCRGEIVQGPEIEPDAIFTHGGRCDGTEETGPEDEAAELCSAAQGVRFRIEATRTDHTAHDLVAQIVAKANVPLTEALADALLAGLKVCVRAATWPGAQAG